jgi:hypothetical protein
VADAEELGEVGGGLRADLEQLHELQEATGL